MQYFGFDFLKWCDTGMFTTALCLEVKDITVALKENFFILVFNCSTGVSFLSYLLLLH